MTARKRQLTLARRRWLRQGRASIQLHHAGASARVKKRDGSHCTRCRKPVAYDPKRWRQAGVRAAIVCLDCRLPFCPRCARKHFAPVQVGRARLMNAVVNAAIDAMKYTRDSCFVEPPRRKR